MNSNRILNENQVTGRPARKVKQRFTFLADPVSKDNKTKIAY